MGDEDKDNKGSNSNSGGGFTQADVDRIVADRLARERGKYADYDELKRKAADADKTKSDVDKLTEAVRTLTERAEKAEIATMKREVADRFKLPKSFANRLGGKTTEDLEREAREMVDELKSLGVDLDKTSGDGGKDAGKDGGKDGGKAGNDGAGNGDGGKDGAGGGGGDGDDPATRPLSSGRPKEQLRSGVPAGGGSGDFDYGKEADKILSGGLI